MKYVMFKVRIGDLTKLTPVIFPNDFVHSMVAEALTSYRDTHGDVVIDGEPVSAGELSVGVGKCYGRSSTLNLDPRPDDDKLINAIDYSHGLVEDEIGPQTDSDGLVDTTGLEPELAKDVQSLQDERMIAETERRFKSSTNSLEESLQKLRTLALMTHTPVIVGRQKRRKRVA